MTNTLCLLLNNEQRLGHAIWAPVGDFSTSDSIVFRRTIMLTLQSILIWNSFGVVELWTQYDEMHSILESWNAFWRYFYVISIRSWQNFKILSNQFISHSKIRIAEKAPVWSGICLFFVLPLTLSSTLTKWIHEFKCPKLCALLAFGVLKLIYLTLSHAHNEAWWMEFGKSRADQWFDFPLSSLFSTC